MAETKKLNPQHVSLYKPNIIPNEGRGILLPITGVFNEKIFDVGDTGLTYRQVHLLDAREEADGSWRRYCLSDLIGIEVVKRIKVLGIQGTAAQKVFAIFSPSAIHCVATEDVEAIKLGITPNAPWQYFSDALQDILKGSQVILVIEEGGKSLFHDALTFEEYIKTHDAFVYVDVNAIVNAVYAEHGVELAPSYKTILQIATELLEDAPESADLSPGERQLIDLIRQEKYDEITIKMDGGNIKRFYGSETLDGNEITPFELMRIVRAGGYKNIFVQLKGKKIASFKQEDIYKPGIR